MTAKIIRLPASDALAQPQSRPLVGVIVQARMGSARFPGKVLAPLLGKPVLQHVIERCRKIKVASNCDKKIIVAVPDLEESEPILELLTKLDVANFCGPEDNVLERYYGAAKFFKTNIIMRITSDCPFTNPLLCSEVLNILAIEKTDYASNIWPTRTFPKGLDYEVFSYECLEATYWMVKKSYTALLPIKKMDSLNKNQQKAWDEVLYDQEHVTPYMQREPGITKSLVKQRRDHSHKNLCVDWPGDIKRLERMLKKQPELKVVK